MNLLSLCIAIVIASVPFQILRFFAGVTEKYLQPFEGIHSDLKVQNSQIVENSPRSRWSLDSIVLAELFEIALPAFFFALILPFLPFSGIKAGVFFGILIFFVGSLPQMAIIPQSIKLPVNFIVVHLFWQLLKNLVVFGMIGAVYRF
jgi:hypothetical protein